MKDINKVKQGKKSRRDGMLFELKVREDLESKNWIVDRWSNQVQFPDDNINKPPKERTGELVKAKSNRFNMRTCGFPDFVCFKYDQINYQVLGVECKMKGKLSKEEKEKCSWLLKNNIFSKIFVASKREWGVEYGEVKQ